METEEGQFDVLWKIPIRGDLRPPITPSFPPHCSSVTAVSTEVLQGSLVERWRMDCGVKGLEDQTIEISGLEFTLIDVFLHIEMQDGRIYDAVVKGSSPRYTVQPGPGLLNISLRNFMGGLRHGVGRLELWIFLAALTLLFGRSRNLFYPSVLLGLGYAVGFVANAFGMIDIDIGWGRAAVSLLSLALVLQYSWTHSEPYSGDKDRSLSQGILSIGILLAGALLGSGFSGEWSSAGIATLDIPVALFSYVFGIWASLLLMFGVTSRMHILIGHVRIENSSWLGRIPENVIGAGGAFLLFRSMGTIISSGIMQPYVRPETMVAALAIGYWAGKLGNERGVFRALIFLIALTVGVALAALDVPIPLVSTMIPVSLALLGVGIVFSRKLPMPFLLPLSVFCGLFQGWVSGNWLTEHMGTVRSSAVGIVLLCCGIVFLTLTVRKGALKQMPSTVDRITGFGFILVALGMRLYGYEASSFSAVSALTTTGGISVPVLSVILFIGIAVVIAVYFTRFKQKTRPPRAALIAATFLIIGLATYPYGRIVFARPFVSVQKISEDETKGIITDLLQNTYRAVNLQDEFEIYDKLALSVHGDLIEKIYLESRKRTVLPSQDSPEVQIIEVTIADIIDAKATDDRLGYTYTCEWYVSGTVRHWAHQHNRQNRYVGLITVKRIDETWKIIEWELLDEQRIMDT
jgi:hydrogenase/urease accessory protein HupE